MSAEPKHTQELADWTMSGCQGTLYKNGNPIGAEFVIHNLEGGNPMELISQANYAPKLK